MNPQQWAAVAPNLYISEELGEVLFFYLKTSGETHMLTAFPGEIFSLLSKKHHSLDEISTFMAQLCDTTVDSSWTLKIQNVVNNLYKIGLITPCKL